MSARIGLQLYVALRDHLQSVGCDFIGKADPSALLLEIDHDAGWAVLDVLHCQLQLLRAIALQAA